MTYNQWSISPDGTVYVGDLGTVGVYYGSAPGPNMPRGEEFLRFGFAFVPASTSAEQFAASFQWQGLNHDYPFYMVSKQFISNFAYAGVGPDYPYYYSSGQWWNDGEPTFNHQLFPGGRLLVVAQLNTHRHAPGSLTPAHPPLYWVSPWYPRRSFSNTPGGAATGLVVAGGDWRGGDTRGGYINYVGGNPFVYVRAWTGSGWTDLTGNLNQAFAAVLNPIELLFNYAYPHPADPVGADGYFVQDITFYRGRLLALLLTNSTTAAPGAVMAYGDDGRWTCVALADYTYFHYSTGGASLFADELSGFVHYRGKLYLHGQTSAREWGLWRYTGTPQLEPVFADTHRKLRLQQAWPRAVCFSPTQRSHLILGDAFEDDWGWYDFATNTVTMGSNPGGSCVWALGVDHGGTMWSGDFANYYYWSSDGGHSFSDPEVPGFQPDGDFTHPEVWDWVSWQGGFYGVGCDPGAIVRRRDNATPAANVQANFERVAIVPNDYDSVGVGLMAARVDPFGGDLIIGCGGEPYYYSEEERGATVATVYKFTTAGQWVDIGHGLDWGGGAYIVRTPEVDSEQYLRMTQRADGNGIHRHPRLSQGARPGRLGHQQLI